MLFNPVAKSDPPIGPAGSIFSYAICKIRACLTMVSERQSRFGQAVYCREKRGKNATRAKAGVESCGGSRGVWGGDGERCAAGEGVVRRAVKKFAKCELQATKSPIWVERALQPGVFDQPGG